MPRINSIVKVEKIIIEVIQRFLIKRKFPKTIKNEWFAYQAISKDKGEEELPQYFGDDTKYIDYQKGNIVPIRRIGIFLGFYKIVGIRKPYGDYAMWDDGRKYDLELHHILIQALKDAEDKIIVEVKG